MRMQALVHNFQLVIASSGPLSDLSNWVTQAMGLGTLMLFLYVPAIWVLFSDDSSPRSLKRIMQGSWYLALFAGPGIIYFDKWSHGAGGDKLFEHFIGSSIAATVTLAPVLFVVIGLLWFLFTPLAYFINAVRHKLSVLKKLRDERYRQKDRERGYARQQEQREKEEEQRRRQVDATRKQASTEIVVKELIKNKLFDLKNQYERIRDRLPMRCDESWFKMTCVDQVSIATSTGDVERRAKECAELMNDLVRGGNSGAESISDIKARFDLMRSEIDNMGLDEEQREFYRARIRKAEDEAIREALNL